MTDDATLQEAGRATAAHAQLVMMAAARLGQLTIQLRAEMLERSRRASLQREQEMQASIRAQRALDSALWRHPLDHRDSVSLDEVSRAYQAAKSWGPHDAEAADHATLLEQLAHERWEVDLTLLNEQQAEAQQQADAEHDQAEQAEQAEQEQAEQEQAEQEQAEQEQAESVKQDRDRDRDEADVVETVALAAVADGLDQDSSSDTEPITAGLETPELHDTPQRREATRRAVSAKVEDPRAVEARMTADTANALPPSTATSSSRPRGRRAPSQGTTRGRARSDRGLSR